MKKCIVLLINLIHQSHGIIYKFNDTEYERMPPLIHIDEYENCFNEPDALYCTSEIELVSDTPSELLNLIHNYSERTLTHFNHSRLYYGVCMKKSCNISKQEALKNLNHSLEECLNYTLWKNYELKVKLSTPPQCYSKDDKIEINGADVIVAVVCLLIIMVNILATTFDIYAKKEPESKGLEILLSFSILRNWKRLHSTGYRSKPQVESLKGIDGLRALTTILTTMVHCFMPFVTSVTNPSFFEQAYNYTVYHIFINGSVVIQWFLVMAGFFLSYNTLRSAERNKLHWTDITSSIFKRWLRLTPSFAIVLAFISTWLRFIGSGPLWQIGEMEEIKACRRDWPWTLMYISNYKDDSSCMPQAWYVTTNMHLHCLGILILVLCTRSNLRNLVLAIMFFIGILTSGLHTYFLDLNPTMLVSPESLREFFINDQTFHHLYKRTHTNIASYVIGLSTGILVHHLQKTNFDIQKYKKFVILYWSVIPFAVGLMIACSIFYIDGPRAPLFIRVLFQMFFRPLIGAVFAVLIFGFVFKCENILRPVFEWNGWVWMARVSYSVYITNLTYFRTFYANSKTLSTISPFVAVEIFGQMLVSFLIAVIFWHIIEAPVNQIVKICMESPTKKENITSNDKTTNEATQVAKFNNISSKTKLH